MTDLKEMEKMEERKIKHNWLYSVNPGPAESIYLVGYDKQCRKYFTAKLRTGVLENAVVFGDLDIPVWGCEPID